MVPRNLVIHASLTADRHNGVRLEIISGDDSLLLTVCHCLRDTFDASEKSKLCSLESRIRHSLRTKLYTRGTSLPDQIKTFSFLHFQLPYH